MPHVAAKDGVKLYYEETGSGRPIVFVHEFAGDCRGYEAQMRFFGRRFRCVAFNARGYPPSDVPDNPASYSQAQARDDLLAVLDGLGLERAHIVGVSMGAFATLHFGLAYPRRASALVIVGCGYGAAPEFHQQFLRESEAAARRFETMPMADAARAYALGPARMQLLNKDPRGWDEFRAQLADHSPLGSALTLRGVQMRRPSLYDLTAALRALDVPTLLMTGDEDEQCLEPSLMMKRAIATAGLVVMPRTGHAVNLEEPARFNEILADFFHQVEAGRWSARDPRSATGAIM